MFIYNGHIHVYHCTSEYMALNYRLGMFFSQFNENFSIFKRILSKDIIEKYEKRIKKA